MIDPLTLVTYCAIVFGFVFMPGPATFLTVARASASGTKAGLATGMGITLGDIIHTVFAVVGLSAVIATSAFLFSLIKYAGAAYLLYLGVRALMAKTPEAWGEGQAQMSAAQAFRQGILAEVLNPKAALFFLAFLPQFVDPSNGYVMLQLTVFGVIFAVLGFVSTAFFAIGAGALGSFMKRNPKVLKWQGKVIGGIYCALGIRLALQER